MMDGMMLNGGRGGLPPAQFLTNLVSVFSSLPVLGPRPSFRERFEVNLATPLLPLFSLPKLQCCFPHQKLLLSSASFHQINQGFDCG